MNKNFLELAPRNKFKCFCGKNLDFEQEENLANHIENCPEYKRSSPLGEVFYKIPLSNLEIGQLLALRSEYLKYALAVNEQLAKRKFFSFF